MITSGFNHADSGTIFNEIFNANDKPLIYHFENGDTIVMNKGDDGYYSKVGNVNYFYGAEGIIETEEKSGGVELETLYIENSSFQFTITDDFIEQMGDVGELQTEIANKILHDELIKIKSGKICSIYVDSVDIAIYGFADLERYQVSFMDSEVLGTVYGETWLYKYEYGNNVDYLLSIKSFPLKIYDTDGIAYTISCDLHLATVGQYDRVQATIKNITFPYGTITSR